MGRTISLKEERLKVDRERQSQGVTMEKEEKWVAPEFLRDSNAQGKIPGVPRRIVPQSSTQPGGAQVQTPARSAGAVKPKPLKVVQQGQGTGVQQVRQVSPVNETVKAETTVRQTRRLMVKRSLPDKEQAAPEKDQGHIEPVDEQTNPEINKIVEGSTHALEDDGNSLEVGSGSDITDSEAASEEQFPSVDTVNDLYYPPAPEVFPETVLEEARKKKKKVKDDLAKRTASESNADTLKVLAEVIDDVKLTKHEKQALYNELRREIAGYGVLDPYMDDSVVTEVMLNDHLHAYVKVNGTIRPISLKFDSAKALANYIQNLILPIQRPLDETNTNLNGQLPDGTRLNATCPPQSKEYTLNLRKPPGKTHRFTAEDYVNSGAVTKEIIDYLGYYHRRRATILILGATDTGKTTVIRILIENYSDPRERWIFLEDTFEVNAKHPHFLPFQQVQKGSDESDWFTLEQIFDRTVLRKAPDRIGVGEILRREATALVRSVSAGHDGFIGSMHAGSPEKGMFLLVVKLKEAGMEIGEEYLRRMLHECIDFMVILDRSQKTGRRVIKQVWEVLSMEEAEGLGVKPFNLLYKFNPRAKDFEKVSELVSQEKKDKFGSPGEVIEW